MEAAQAYDRESVLRKGVEAITNFDLSEYIGLLSPEDEAIAVQRGLISNSEAAAQQDPIGNLGTPGPQLEKQLLPQSKADVQQLVQQTDHQLTIQGVQKTIFMLCIWHSSGKNSVMVEYICPRSSINFDH